MEKIQRVQQQPPRLKAVNPHPQGKRPVPPPAVNPLLRLFQKHPLLIVCGMWSGFLVLASWAIIGLTDPGQLKESEQKPTAVEYSSAQDAQNEGRLPFWLFGAIAVGCATGSWLIVQQLNSPKQRRPVRRQQSRTRPTPQQSDSQVGQRRQPAQSPRPTVPASRTQKPSIPPRPRVAKPFPTDVPELPRRPLNKKLASLTDRMDIRKR